MRFSSLLACPTEGTFDAVETIVGVKFSAYMSSLLHNHDQFKPKISDWSLKALEYLVEVSGESFQYLWTPNICSIYAASQNNDVRAFERFVFELILERLWKDQTVGNLESAFYLYDDASVRIGNVTYDHVAKIQYRSEDRSVIVEFGNGDRFEHTRLTGLSDLLGSVSDKIKINPSLMTSQREVYGLFRRNLIWYGTEYLRPEANDDFLDGIDTTCSEALIRLKKNNPEYSLWVEKLLAYLSPWENTLDSMPGGSGSSNMSPGLVGICNFPHADSFADSLIHEISHQYFFLTQLIEPACDGSDDSLYYNPFLEVDRPIEKILFAYHAFANVFLYTHSVIQSGSGDMNYIHKRYSDLIAGLRILDRNLSETDSLTETGKGIWFPLREAIDHTDIYNFNG